MNLTPGARVRTPGDRIAEVIQIAGDEALVKYPWPATERTWFKQSQLRLIGHAEPSADVCTREKST